MFSSLPKSAPLADSKTNKVIEAIKNNADITDEKILTTRLDAAFITNKYSLEPRDEKQKTCLMHAIESGNPLIVKWAYQKDGKQTSQNSRTAVDLNKKNAFSYAIEYPDNGDEKNLANEKKRAVLRQLITLDFSPENSPNENFIALCDLIAAYGNNFYAFKCLFDIVIEKQQDKKITVQPSDEDFHAYGGVRLNDTHYRIRDSYTATAVVRVSAYNKDSLLNFLLTKYKLSFTQLPTSQRGKASLQTLYTSLCNYHQNLIHRILEDEKQPVEVDFFNTLSGINIAYTPNYDQRFIQTIIKNKKKSFEQLKHLHSILSAPNSKADPYIQDLEKLIAENAFQILNNENANLEPLKLHIMQNFPQKEVFQRLIQANLTATDEVRNKTIERLCLLRSQMIDLDPFNQAIGDIARKNIGEEIAKLILKGEEKDFALVTHTFKTNLILAQHVADYLKNAITKDPAHDTKQITIRIATLKNEAKEFIDFKTIEEALAPTNAQCTLNSLLDEKQELNSVVSIFKTIDINSELFTQEFLKAYAANPRQDILLDKLFGILQNSGESINFRTSYDSLTPLFTQHLIAKIKNPAISFTDIQPYLTNLPYINYTAVIQMIQQEVADNKISVIRAKEICESIKASKLNLEWDSKAAIQTIGENGNFYLAPFLLDNNYFPVNACTESVTIEGKSYPITMLSIAASFGNLAMVNFLIKKEALSKADPKEISLALVCAIHFGHHNVVKALLKNGAVFNDELNNAEYFATIIRQSAPNLRFRYNQNTKPFTDYFISAYKAILFDAAEDVILTTFKKLKPADQADLLSLFNHEKISSLPSAIKLAHNSITLCDNLDKKIDVVTIPQNMLFSVSNNQVKPKAAAQPAATLQSAAPSVEPIAASFKITLEGDEGQADVTFQSHETIDLNTADAKTASLTSSARLFCLQKQPEATDSHSQITLLEDVLRSTLTPSGIANPKLAKMIQAPVLALLTEIGRRYPETAERINKILIDFQPGGADCLAITGSNTSTKTRSH